VPGNATRLVDRKLDGRVFWEGKLIAPDDPVP
jgi:hypothetical protein